MIVGSIGNSTAPDGRGPSGKSRRYCFARRLEMNISASRITRSSSFRREEPINSRLALTRRRHPASVLATRMYKS